MSILPYHRSRAWSSTYALSCIAAKGSMVEKRLVQIGEIARTLEAEKAELFRIRDDLVEAERAERERLERRGNDLQQPLDGDVSVPTEDASAAPAAISDRSSDFQTAGVEPADSGSVRMVELSMSEVGQAAPYDQDRCLFVVSPDNLHRSTRPRRIDVSQPGFDDPLMRRAVKLLETPGLLHMMVLAERSQVVIDPDSFVVPEASLGLPLADAYLDQVFSLEALNALSDPETADDFLVKVMRDEVEPGLQ